MEAASTETPLEISAVLVADEWQTAKMLTRSLAAQRQPDRIELVVVTHRGSGFEPGPETELLGGLQVVEVDSIRDISTARVHGIERVSSPIVFLAETHCFPQEGWLDAVLEAHRQGATYVGPRFASMNPASVVSRANFAEHYGEFSGAIPDGPRARVAGNNASFSVDAVRHLGDDLEASMRDFAGFQETLAGDGEIRLAADAVVRHLNVSRLRGWLIETWAGGRLGAGSRCRSWSRERRLGYALAFPLIAVVEFHRRRPGLRRLQAAGEGGLGTDLLLAAGILWRCYGEAVGFLWGPGSRETTAMSHMEVRRFDYINGSDRELIHAAGEELLARLPELPVARS